MSWRARIDDKKNHKWNVTRNKDIVSINNWIKVSIH